MNLNEIKNRIQSYLRSSKSWPLIVDVQTKEELADIVDFFKIGNNKFLSMGDFCHQDESLNLDELYKVIADNNGNSFILGLTGFLKILGEEATRNTLKTVVTTGISGHIVILTYQCKNYLKFSDPRIYENGRIIIADGTPDDVADLYFVPPALSDAFPGAYQGVQKIGQIIENCTHRIAHIVTDVRKDNYPESIYYIRQLNNGYNILQDIDPRTSTVPESFGTAEQWTYALQKIGKGTWSSIIEELFGSEIALTQALSAYHLFDKQKRWMYFIALSMCGVKDNAYLQLAVNNASGSDELIQSIYRTILTIDRNDPDFIMLYRQRKDVIRELRNTLPEVLGYCKVVSVKEENAVYYLTDMSQPEKERIIRWLSAYGENYSASKLESILRTVYPDLAKYLSKYRFKSKLLDYYFDTYKYQKVINHVLPSFEAVVDEQVERMDFVTELKPRSTAVDKIDVRKSRAYFVDALGVEYLGFIQEKCSEYGLSANISCARCELPSLTLFNKEFVPILSDKGCSVSDIKDLDEVKHHGEDSFDYQKEKTPIYLIRELEIIDNLLNNIRANIQRGQYEKAIILSDHGASRLAVLHETENTYSMSTVGEHSGRCCRTNEIDSKPNFAIEENGFWVLANYDRFKGSRRANVEVHGGASIEEVAVPIIEITQKQLNVEAFIVDESKTILLGAKEYARIKIFVGVESNNVAIKLGDHFYDANPTNEQYVYIIDLPGFTRKGEYTFDIFMGNEIVAREQRFEIKKKGMSEIDLFD